VIIEGAPALMHKSKIKCAKGGVISIQKHNQCLESDGAVAYPVPAPPEEKVSSKKENSNLKDDYKITFRGNDHTNSSSRGNHHPLIIVNHITDTMSFTSTDDWFRSSNNNVSSAHFLVNRKGEIYQYVPIERMAWVNGIYVENFVNVTSEFVKSKGKINPNLYTVGIEHTGTDGTLTEEQFRASIWLHKHIQSYVASKWSHTILFDRKYILGHYEIDPVNKPYCPGPNFPWDRLMSALNS
jgi:N-acetyl-anhydromuramyl-L-alanine amidase AmpD